MGISRVVFQLDEVIGVIKPVRSPVRANGLVCKREGDLEEIEQLAAFDPGLAARESFGVNLFAILAAGARQPIKHLLALAVIDAVREQGAMALQNAVHGQQKFGDFIRQVHLGFFQRAENFQAEGQKAAQITKCDHGNAVANQGVIGVVPFRSLGVQPDARLRDEIGELGKQRNEKFFAQIDEAHMALLRHKRACHRSLSIWMRRRTISSCFRSKITVSLGSLSNSS